MVVRHSQAAKLAAAKAIARSNKCFIVEGGENKNGKPVKFFLLYREAEPRNVLVGRRSSIDGLLAFVEIATQAK